MRRLFLLLVVACAACPCFARDGFPAVNEAFLDLGASSNKTRKTEPSYGEVDFDRVDFLHVPLRPTRNLLVNGGFEQGLKGWKFHFPHGIELKPYAKAVENGGELYERTSDDAKFGRKACELRSIPVGTPSDGLSSMPISVFAGRPYVLSGWTKETGGVGCYVSFRLASSVKGGLVTAPDGQPNPFRHIVARSTAAWRRFELPFVTTNGAVEVVFNGRGMLVDGLMVEEGEKATETTDDPLVAHLVTNDPENDLAYGGDYGARVTVSRFDPQVPLPKGASLRVRIHDFYHETVYDRTFDVSAGSEFPLELDAERLGEGVFVVRYDFALPQTDGTLGWTDYERFSVMRFLDNDHPTAFFFLHYPWFQTHGSLGPRLAKWMRTRGIGSTSWPRCADRAASPLRELYATGKFRSGLHVFEHDLRRRHPDRFGKSGTLVTEYTKEVTEERLAFIRNEAYALGRECDAAETSWCFSNEEEGKFPLKDGKPDFDGYFRFQKAAYDGLKKAFDERGLKLRYAPTHGMCQFNPSGLRSRGTYNDRRWVFESMLDAAHRAHFRYDLLSMHLYWAVDGTIVQRWRRTDVGTSIFDRNENAQALFAIARKYGYGEDVPVRFEEGFNTLPFFIPQWKAHGWADDYDSVTPSQAMGNTEFVQASAIARQYLMDLRWWPRVETSHVWQHRPVMDMALTPWMWTKVSNTLGHLLPDPRCLAAVKLSETVRAFVYEQGDHGVLAIWTTDNEVELARKKGPTVNLRLPADAAFIDLMGNRRTVEKPAGDTFAVPLTPAPLFVVSKDAYALIRTGVILLELSQSWGWLAR